MQDFEQLVSQYDFFLKDSENLGLQPDMEGDVLHVIGIRDDIHELYTHLSDAQKDSVQHAVRLLKELDSKLQNIARTTKTDDYLLGTSGQYSEWWYNLDRLDELTKEELELI